MNIEMLCERCTTAALLIIPKYKSSSVCITHTNKVRQFINTLTTKYILTNNTCENIQISPLISGAGSPLILIIQIINTSKDLEYIGDFVEIADAYKQFMIIYMMTINYSNADKLKQLQSVYLHFEKLCISQLEKYHDELTLECIDEILYITSSALNLNKLPTGDDDE